MEIEELFPLSVYSFNLNSNLNKTCLFGPTLGFNTSDSLLQIGEGIDGQTRCQECATMDLTIEPPGEHRYENWTKK